MQDLRMREDQFGPTAHIGTCIPGYMCSHCDFATCDTTSDEPEPLSMREHWQQHRHIAPGEHDPLSCGGDLKFQACFVQSFNHDRCSTLWLPVLPGLDAKLIQLQMSFTELLLSGHQSSIQSPIPITARNSRKAVLSFFFAKWCL